MSPEEGEVEGIERAFSTWGQVVFALQLLQANRRKGAGGGGKWGVEAVLRA